MNRVLFTIAVLAFFTVSSGYAQNEENEFKPSGKASGTIFLNYHYDATEGAEKKSQIELLRAYLGYSYNFSEKIWVKI